MNQDLKQQVLDKVDAAWKLCQGKAPSERELLEDVKRMIASGCFKRSVDSRDFEETISYTVPK